MVRKKAESCKKTNPFAPPGKLLMIERNRSLNSTLKTPKSSKTSPRTPLKSPVQDKLVTLTKSPATEKGKRRVKPGIKAIREIKKFQANTGLLVPRESFSRVVREIMQTSFAKPDYRFSKMAMLALQEATEMAVVNLLEVANLCCIHAKRVTLTPSDIRLTRRAFGLGNPVND